MAAIKRLFLIIPPVIVLYNVLIMAAFSVPLEQLYNFGIVSSRPFFRRCHLEIRNSHQLVNSKVELEKIISSRRRL